MFASQVSRRAFSAASQHTRIAVVGAGCGGQSLVAQLARSGKVDASEITVFDPRTHHHYQPGYTMIAGGVLGNADHAKAKHENDVIIRPQQELFNKTPGVKWNQSAVTTFDPENNSITLADGSTTTYDVLIVNPGL